ncbi:MAG: YraN family protein [Zavarzinia sp.]|nr:YraN family protein [Zavarzinia sp.]
MNRRRTTPEERRRALRAGRRAETLAALFLMARGWRILARDWRCKSGEIDLVARRRHIVAFIEVKYRPEPGEAGEAIRPRQRERILRAAGLFMAGRPALAGLDIRFDAVLVSPWRLPRHIADAWRIE